ncbi:MAG: hypothetical protein ABI211_12800, partial [Vicinamibacterales bacterium]
GVSGARAQTPDARQPAKAVDSQRVEGDAVLALADAAMNGQKPAIRPELMLGWQNVFLKAQQGTFVPFTVAVTTSGTATLPDAVLVYVRAVRRGGEPPRPPAADRARRPDRRTAEAAAEITYPVDAIFPVELAAGDARNARVRRGFSIAPGDYDIYVVVRERPRSVLSAASPRAAVLTQRLTVPDFWNGELTTSSVMLADRLTVLPAPLGADELVERPYVIGQNEVVPAEDSRFQRGEELVVVFLVYNPTVTPEKRFDLQVEYHFFRKGGSSKPGSDRPGTHPLARDGERYFNHTDPQRFNPAVMGGQFDPSGGQPVLAGQGVPLAAFEAGDYRLAITITDVISGATITRDVAFTVGS